MANKNIVIAGAIAGVITAGITGGIILNGQGTSGQMEISSAVVEISTPAYIEITKIDETEYAKVKNTLEKSTKFKVYKNGDSILIEGEKSNGTYPITKLKTGLASITASGSKTTDLGDKLNTITAAKYGITATVQPITETAK